MGSKFKKHSQIIIYECPVTEDVSPTLQRVVLLDRMDAEEVVESWKYSSGGEAINISPSENKRNLVNFDRDYVINHDIEIEGGIPDLFCRSNGSTHFCEVKNQSDVLRPSQEEWFEKHSHLDIRIAFVAEVDRHVANIHCPNCEAVYSFRAAKNVEFECKSCGEDIVEGQPLAKVETKPSRGESRKLMQPNNFDNIIADLAINSKQDFCQNCELPSDDVDFRTLDGDKYWVCGSCFQKVKRAVRYQSE
jgi:ribosomal protein L37AE/L43A